MEKQLVEILRFICMLVMNIAIGVVALICDLFYYPFFIIIYAFYATYNFGNHKKVLNLYRFVSDKLQYNAGFINFIRLLLGYDDEE